MASRKRIWPSLIVTMVGVSVIGGVVLGVIFRGGLTTRRGAATVLRPADTYVGSRVCAECHTDIHHRYQSHPMAQSLSHVRDARVIEDFRPEVGFDGPPAARGELQLRYLVTRDAQEQQHHEATLDAAGNLIYDQSVPVHYAVGSGRRGRSYITNRDGLLFMSPISWYTQQKRWDLSPSYDLENVRFERRITEECLGCHAGRVALVPEQRNRFAREPLLEASIGCERCHGPGREHVDLHRFGDVARGSDPIVNPERLAPGERDSVCFQCHFHGQGRLARYGRSGSEFRPGENVSRVWTILFDDAGVAGDGTTDVVSQAEQMLASTCYRRSNGRLGCTSCHDPHSVPQPEERVEFYRARCLACHGSSQPVCRLSEEQRRAATRDDSCIECHMPSLEARDVPHTSQTDHRVVRSRDAVGRRERNDIAALPAFGEETGELPAPEIERARGVLMVGRAERDPRYQQLAVEAIPKLRTWWEVRPDDVTVAEALSTAYWRTNDAASAVKVLERALARNPNCERALWHLALIHQEQGDSKTAVKYARRLVELNPWNHGNFAGLAYMLGCIGRYREGIAAAHRALELNPSAIELHGWLGEAYGIEGDRERSEFHRDIYHRLSAGK